ncbi:hypothetical protein [Azonexus sp. IMCC34839]
MTEIVGAEDAGEFFAPASTDMIDGPFDNQFPGASVSVVILVAERQL